MSITTQTVYRCDNCGTEVLLPIGSFANRPEPAGWVSVSEMNYAWSKSFCGVDCAVEMLREK